MRARLVGPDDPAWPAALAVCVHDVHHLPGWAVASAVIDDGAPRAVLVEDAGRVRCVAPVLARDLDGPDGRWDAVSPYGYAGPAFPADLDDAGRRAALDVAAGALAADGCVAWFLRLHPLLDDGWSTGAEGACDHGRTVSIDLTADDTTFRAGLRAGHRGDVDRAVRDGVRVDVVAGPDVDDPALVAFRDLYAATMDRVGADPYYAFPDAYYAALVAGLGDDLLVLVARGPDGAPLAGALFTARVSSGVGQYHLSGTAGGSGLQATKLVVATARRVLRDRGLSVLHLGGGRGAEEDSLFRFKAGFAPGRHTYRSLRRVLDPAEYARRCAAVGVDPASGDTGHFPAYRAGVRAAPPGRGTVR